MKKKSLSAKKINHKKILLKFKDKEIVKTYRKFKKNIEDISLNSNFAAAISGGPDSMALAFFLKLFSLEKKKEINYYHVDHLLRNSSKYEAIEVKKHLKLIGVDLKILKWKGDKPTSNIQSISRKARYELILKKLNNKFKNIIFFAHTEDDLIENFLIRLSRGSGLKGFVSFNSQYFKSKDHYICRPLLNISKDKLIYVSNKIFKFFVNDPSNYDLHFKRSRIRDIIKRLKNEKFDFKKIKLTIDNLSQSNDVIEYYVRENIRKYSKINKKNKIVIINNELFKHPKEIIFRSLAELINVVNNRYYPARGKKITRLLNKLYLEKSLKLTLSRCVIEKANNLTIIYKENQKKG